MNRREFTDSLWRCGCGCLLAGGLLPTVNAQSRKKAGKPAPQAAPADGWELYTQRRLGFQARFPTEPKESIEQGRVSYSAAFQAHQLIVNLLDATRAQAVWTPAAIKELTTKSKPENFSFRSTRQLAPNLLEYRAVQTEQEGEAQIAGRFYLTREIEYIALVRADVGLALDAEIVRRFFAGFKVIPHPPLQQQAPQQPGRYQRTPIYTSCTNCGGRGVIRTTCYRCRGFGQNDPSEWAREGRTCRWCYGRGYSSSVSCYRCGGSGQVQM